MSLTDLPPDTPCALIVGSESVATTLGELRERLGERGDRVLSTGDAARIWPAYSESSWRQWASEGLIQKAWQDTEGGPWRLPYASCRSFVAERQRRALRRGKRGPKGPWEKSA